MQRFKAIVGLFAVMFVVAIVFAAAFTAGLVSYISNLADRKVINEIKLHNFGTEILSILKMGEDTSYMEVFGDTAADNTIEIERLEKLLDKMHKDNYNVTVTYQDKPTLSYGEPLSDEVLFFEAEIPVPGAVGKDKGVLVLAIW